MGFALLKCICSWYCFLKTEQKFLWFSSTCFFEKSVLCQLFNSIFRLSLLHHSDCTLLLSSLVLQGSRMIVIFTHLARVWTLICKKCKDFPCFQDKLEVSHAFVSSALLLAPVNWQIRSRHCSWVSPRCCFQKINTSNPVLFLLEDEFFRIVFTFVSLMFSKFCLILKTLEDLSWINSNGNPSLQNDWKVTIFEVMKSPWVMRCLILIFVMYTLDILA